MTVSCKQGTTANHTPTDGAMFIMCFFFATGLMCSLTTLTRSDCLLRTERYSCLTTGTFKC